ncbi:hypothetical protein [Pseudomonas helleri]|uniref:recombination directionality factor n=1 Tax=Pseudomonas helleri TaxID=1608996 RepID=UPI00242ED212|nr:hypothetical protein [Pseudomonas helleri]
MTTSLIASTGPGAIPTLLGQSATRLPVGGKIRAGIKVLTRQAAEHAQAQALYDHGVAAGQSFEQIELAIVAALPTLKHPLVPRNVPWFTVRAQDFANPELARQIVDAYGEDRGDGERRLYRFPVVFPSDHWPTVMPHELSVWGAREKRYWSQYSADGRVRQCWCPAPVSAPVAGKRPLRPFGGRQPMLRPDNGGVCDPEACPQYQQRECNLRGRFLFFIPGIRSISVFELHTTSFYAMNAAIQTFETISFLRGGRISGFLDRERTPFFLSKHLREVVHLDAAGQPVRVPQWIIQLEAPVDVTALLRERDDPDTALAQAQVASQLLAGDAPAPVTVAPVAPMPMPAPVVIGAAVVKGDEPSLAQLMEVVASFGIDVEHYTGYADQRWGTGWKLNRQGRRRAWDELERYRNDPHGYADKLQTELAQAAKGRA